MGVLRELFGEKWQRDIESALYMNKPNICLWVRIVKYNNDKETRTVKEQRNKMKEKKEKE